MRGNPLTKSISREVKTTVRRQIKRINRWRGLNVPWKAILKEVGLQSVYNEKTLANHYHNRGLI